MSGVSETASGDMAQRLDRLEKDNQALRTEVTDMQARLAKTVTPYQVVIVIAVYTGVVGILRAVGL